MNFGISAALRLHLASGLLGALLLCAGGGTLTQVATAQTALLAGEGRVILEADGFIEWNREAGYYAAEENVRLRRDDWSLSSQSIRAYYDTQRDTQREGEQGAAASGLPNDLERAHAFGDPVRIESKDGTLITAPQVLWWPQEGRLETSGAEASLTRTGGERLRAQESLVWWESLGGRPVAEAHGEVIAEGRGGEVLQADKIRALFSQTAGEIEEYQATGDVTVTRANGEIAKSERARYDVGAQRIVLEGDVRLERDGQLLQGARAEMDLASGRSSLLPSEGGRVQGRFNPENPDE